MRSILTVLGILIGIAAVILTVGLGLGTQKDVSAQISQLGSNLLIVKPGSSTSTEGVRGGFGSRTTLTTADAEALASSVNAPDIGKVAAEKTTSASLEANDTNWTTSVVGTSTDWLDVRGRTLATGAFFTADDEADRAAVVVLGPETAEELFGSTRVVGQTVTIGDTDLRVVGVLEAEGASRRQRPRRRRGHPHVDGGGHGRRRLGPERGLDDLRPGRLDRPAERGVPGGARPCCSTCTGSPTPTAPTSRSTARTPWCPRRPRSTRP